ncbi:low affinity immunoglobulin epsilon Fc receptor-like [Babylonia areolata]|uniref:low affinity immunoglobulin epsilon Fc receptor-like n=1 Tax=Babylonia areolata TaxID=304850 RepID=UPI003FCFA687
MRIAVFCAVLFALLECGVSDCPTPWRGNQTSCYLHFHEPYTFFEAKIACDIVQGHLVEINSPEENAFVASLAKQHRDASLWIGLEDFVIEGEYEWTSSHTKPEFYNWKPNEPNNYYNNEDCVLIEASTGGWFDVDCVQKHPFLCESLANNDGNLNG